MQPRVVLTDILKGRKKFGNNFKHFLARKDDESSENGDNLCKNNANLQECNNQGNLSHHGGINSAREEKSSNSHVTKNQKPAWIIHEYLKDNGRSVVPVLGTGCTTGDKSQHSIIKPLPVCHKCGLTFSAIWYLKKHLSLSKHDTSGYYRCSVEGCHARFLSSTDLKLHIHCDHKGELNLNRRLRIENRE